MTPTWPRAASRDGRFWPTAASSAEDDDRAGRLARLRPPAPGRTRDPGRRARRRGRLLGGDAALRRPLVADDDAAATRSVPLDCRARSRPTGQGRASRRWDRRGRAGRAQASPVATAPFAGVGHSGADRRHDTGAGAVLAVPPGYLRHIDAFRFLHGGLRAGAVVLDQQLAATLRARVGDRVDAASLGGRNAAAFHGRRRRPASAPPTSSSSRSTRRSARRRLSRRPTSRSCPFAHLRRNGRRRALPRCGAASAGSRAVPGTLNGVQWQVQAQLDPRRPDAARPSAAFKRAGQDPQLAWNAACPGRSSSSTTSPKRWKRPPATRSYAETLYIMLAVPGALLALGLAYLAALGTVERDRRDLALLRARGASRRESAGDGRGGSGIVGSAGRTARRRRSLRRVATLVEARSGSIRPGRLDPSPLCIALAISAGCLPGSGPAAARCRRPSRPGARPAHAQTPLWQRLYLDFVALGAQRA